VENVLQALHARNGSSLFYKNAAGLWFDLNHPSATGGDYLVPANALVNPGTTLPPIYYGSVSQIVVGWTPESCYYVGQDLTIGEQFSVEPADAALEAKDQTNGDAAQFQLQSLGNGSWTATIQGKMPGSSMVTVQASCSGYATWERQISINVVPLLGSSVQDNVVTIVSDGSPLWSTGDLLELRIINGATHETVCTLPVSVIDAETVCGELPRGLSSGEYHLYLLNNGIPIAATKIEA